MFKLTIINAGESYYNLIIFLVIIIKKGECWISLFWW